MPHNSSNQSQITNTEIVRILDECAALMREAENRVALIRQTKSCDGHKLTANQILKAMRKIETIIKNNADLHKTNTDLIFSSNTKSSLRSKLWILLYRKYNPLKDI
jgi:hypothetical protein